MKSSRIRTSCFRHSRTTAVSHSLHFSSLWGLTHILTDYDIRASSTISLAIELRVPMLVTNRTRRTYGFIDDDRVVVTRPQVMSEVQALKAFRTGDVSGFLASDPAETGLTMGDIPAVRDAVEHMMRTGWTRSRSGWAEWRAWLWQRNTDVARRILRDLP